MADLEYDTDAFYIAVTQYRDLSEKMTALKLKLEQELMTLTNTDWVSSASTMYMDKYKNTWAQNVQEYVDLIRHLEDILQAAGREYAGLAERIRDIRMD